MLDITRVMTGALRAAERDFGIPASNLLIGERDVSWFKKEVDRNNLTGLLAGFQFEGVPVSYLRGRFSGVMAVGGREYLQLVASGMVKPL